jgi:hypothetical protein
MACLDQITIGMRIHGGDEDAIGSGYADKGRPSNHHFFDGEDYVIHGFEINGEKFVG